MREPLESTLVSPTWHGRWEVRQDRLVIGGTECFRRQYVDTEAEARALAERWDSRATHKRRSEP
jgi:hypothetical protein